MRTLLTLLAFCTATTLAVAQTTMNIYQSNGTVTQIPINTIDSITYTIGNQGNLAVLTTLPVGNIAGTSATSGGNITSNGGSPVTQRGVVWNSSPNPTTANSQTNDGSGTGSYTSNLTGLTSNTTYYVRAYATNSSGTAYGNQLSLTTTGGGGGTIFNPNLTYGSMTDQDGNTYATIVIGTQEWMAENLRTATYRNGDPIPNIIDNTQWSNLTTGAWAHYNNDSQYESPYGKLYNWYTVNDPRNVCPIGWHVPTDPEWSTFINYLDPNANGGVSNPNTAGGKMKSTGTQYWQNPNTDATNESGFSGVPGGGRDWTRFGAIGHSGLWWSSTVSGTDGSLSRFLRHDTGSATETSSYQQAGYSVRCVRD